MKHLYEFDHYLTEGKNVADSYHFTTVRGLQGILTSGIRFSMRKFEREQQESWWRNRLSKRNDDYTKYISLTRHKDIGKILNEMTEMPIRLTLDTAAITNRYKIVPIDFVGQVTDTQTKSHKHKGDMAMVSSIAANAFEERIISSKKDETTEYLPLQYIKKIDVFMKSGTSHDKIEMEDIRTALGRSGIAYEMHLTYPKPASRVKSEYNLQNIQFIDGLTLNKISPQARKTFSTLVAHMQDVLKSDCLTFSAMLSVDSYWIKIDADLPYYEENPEDSMLYSATISKAGVLKSEKYKHENIERFNKRISEPYLVDDYMNDQVLLYSVKDLKATVDYERKGAEVVITSVRIIDHKAMSADIVREILSTILPSSDCYVILPPELLKYRVETTFEKGDYYFVDEENPARIDYKPSLYTDEY